MSIQLFAIRLAAFVGLAMIGALSASAATNITNSLTGFTGNSFQMTTQDALAGVGLNFTSNLAFHEDPPGSFNDPTIQFDSTGAHFGDILFGDSGRNFIRTAAPDYANHSFVAEVTWSTFNMFSQAGYFGLGSAEYGNFRIADWGTRFSAVQLFMEVDPVFPDVSTLINDNGSATFGEAVVATGLDTGTNRLRLTYNWFQKTAVFAIDVAYAGGAFTADVTTPPVSTLNLYNPLGFGWPSEPSRVYFGGDDGSTFKDFVVTLSTPAMVFGDLNNSATITSADWVILRNNQHTDISALSESQAYAAGDLSGDKVNDHVDFKLFKTLFDGANGVGAFEAMLASIPEPSTGALVLAALLAAPAARRRTDRS